MTQPSPVQKRYVSGLGEIRELLSETIQHFASIVLLVPYGRFLRRQYKRASKESCAVLVFPPSYPGSLGDEAMMTALVLGLKSKGVKSFGIISHGLAPEWTHVAEDSTPEILGSSFRSFRSRVRLVNAAARYEKMYLIGADVLDGYYSERRTITRLHFVSLVAKMGVKSNIVSVSINDHPTTKSVEAWRSLPENVRICAREPLSQKRLAFCISKPVQLTADLAFLLLPQVNSSSLTSLLNWITNERSQGRAVIGINVNPLHLRIVGEKSHDLLLRAYTDLLQRMTDNAGQFSFVFLHHDLRGNPNDTILNRTILSMLPPEIQAHSNMTPESSNAQELKGVCGILDMILTGRMHVAIAGLSQGIPVACIEYQGKVEGLFGLFSLANMSITAEQAILPGELCKFFLPLLERRTAIRSQILSKLPMIFEMAEENIL